jgi:RNA polymerase sigma factor (sigma-70 family)
MSDELRLWFSQEILPHERALMRFLGHVWPDPAEVNDLCQETYIRVYEAAGVERPQSPRGFLFATARHLISDRVRRDRVVSIELKGDVELLNVLIDEVPPEQQINAQQELWQLAQAFSALSAECREVIWFTKVDLLSQKEVASRLKISVKAVERRLARAISRLREAYLKGLSDTALPHSDIDLIGESDNG